MNNNIPTSFSPDVHDPSLLPRHDQPRDAAQNPGAPPQPRRPAINLQALVAQPNNTDVLENGLVGVLGHFGGELLHNVQDAVADGIDHAIQLFHGMQEHPVARFVIGLLPGDGEVEDETSSQEESLYPQTPFHSVTQSQGTPLTDTCSQPSAQLSEVRDRLDELGSPSTPSRSNGYLPQALQAAGSSMSPGTPPIPETISAGSTTTAVPPLTLDEPARQAGSSVQLGVSPSDPLSPSTARYFDRPTR